MRTSSLSATFVGLALFLLTTGCSSPNPSASCIPVSLTVTYKGKPVEDAQVTFAADGKDTRTCQGTTDQSGRAILGTFSTDDGAMPGSYKVSVSKAKGMRGAVTAGMGDASKIDSDAAAGLSGKASFVDPAAAYTSQINKKGEVKNPEQALPVKYATVDTSGLTFTVQGPGANDFKVELKD